MRRTRGSVIKADHGTHRQKHSAVHAEHKSAHEQSSFRKGAAKVLGPKKGGKAY